MQADLRASLEGVRDRLLLELESADSSSSVAALCKQLVDVLVRIHDLPAPKADIIDELKRKRDALRPNPSDAPAKGGKPRAGSGGAGGKRGTGT